MSTTLCQIDDSGAFHGLLLASRQFQQHEANYPPFLLEIANALYSMTRFDKYLRGQPFILYMDQRPQPELPHLHMKTYARLQAASDQYNFVIQNKTGSGLPLHLRTASPVGINAMTPSNPKLLQAQNKSPDLTLIRQFCSSGQWPDSINADLQRQSEELNRNLMIDHHGAAWVHCPTQGSNAPTLLALYLPDKYRHPVVCHFRQRHPDLPVPDQILRLQENYCWIDMKNDLASHPLTCENCKLQKTAQKKPKIPNATIQVDLMGPFTSYGDKKFVLILTDVATKLTVFEPLQDKSISAIAFAIFTQWICKMAVPQVIDTNLTDEQGRIGQPHVGRHPAQPVH